MRLCHSERRASRITGRGRRDNSNLLSGSAVATGTSLAALMKEKTKGALQQDQDRPAERAVAEPGNQLANGNQICFRPPTRGAEQGARHSSPEWMGPALQGGNPFFCCLIITVLTWAEGAFCGCTDVEDNRSL